MSASVGRIELDLGVNSSGFKKEMNSLTKTVNSNTAGLTKAFGAIGKAVAVAFSVKAIVDFSKQCLQLGSDLAEVQNVVDVTFGGMSDRVNDFAKNAMESYGLSETVAKKYMGQFGAMSKAFGNTEAMAYDQASALTGLAGDVASFYNITTDEAFTKLKSVYTGETESLKELGVVMTQTALDEYAYRKGIGKTTKEMSEQEKVALRLSFVTDNLATAAGDYARTSNGWANQVRELSLRFEEFKATIGQGLINVLLPLLQTLNDLMVKLQGLAEKFRAFTAAVFGDAGGMSSAAGNVADSSGVISSNIGSAAASAEELKKQLAGFDELNVLSSNSSPGSSDGGNSGSGSTSAGSAGTGSSSSVLNMTAEEVEKIKGKLLLVLDVVGAIGGAILGWKLGSFIAELATAGVKAEGFLASVKLLGKQLAIAGGVTLTVTGIVLETEGIISAVRDGLNDINAAEISGGGMLSFFGATLLGAQFGNALLGAGIGAVVAGIPMFVVGVYDAIKNGLNELNALVIPAGSTIAGAGIAAIIGSLGGPLGAGIGALIGLVIGLITDFTIWLWQEYDTIKGWFLDLPGWAQVIVGAIGYILVALSGVFSIIAGVIIAIKDWDAIVAWVKTNVAEPLGKLFEPLVTAAKAVWTWLDVNLFTPFREAFAEAKDYAVKKFTEIKDGLVAAFSVIWNKVVEIYNKIKEIFSALWWAFKEYVWNPIVDRVTTFYKDKIKPIVDSVKEAFKKIGEAFKERVIDPIVEKFNWIKGKLEEFMGWVVDLFRKISTRVTDFISGLFKSVINAVLSKIEDKINSFIRLLNGAIGIINKIPGVSITKVSEISIPRLATGGYVAANTPQLAVVGDNKREGEIIAPESKIAEAVAKGFAMVLAKMQGQSTAQNDRPMYVTIKLGEGTFWEGFVDYHNSIVKRTGETPLLV